MAFRGWVLPLLLLLPQEPHELEPAPPDLPACVTCDGQGSALFDCEACQAERSGPCVGCVNPVLQLEERLEISILRIRDPERAAEGEEELKALRARIAELWGGSQAGPGKVRCPAMCTDGRTQFTKLFECKVCKGKGALTCGDCRGRAVGPCWSCAGKRRLVVLCPECVGTTRSPGISARDTTTLAVCPWCRDERVRACPADETEMRTCENCAGLGGGACKVCAGTSKKPCERCIASGDLSARRGLVRSDHGPCDTCSAKGVLPCDACTRGRTQCAKCEGKGQAQQPCRVCRGRKRIVCGGCRDGTSRAWLVTAERLIAAGSRELGVAHVEEAIRRETARIAAEVDRLQLSSSERTKQRRNLEREHLTPLRRKLSEVRGD